MIALALGDFLANTKDIAPEAAMYLKCAQLVQQGQKPYIDFFDSSPPILFVIFSLPLKLSQITGLQVANAFGICVASLAVLSVLLAALVMRQGLSAASVDKESKTSIEMKRQIEEAFAPLLIGFAAFNYWVGFEWGQTQHLFSLLYFPFLLVRWMRWRGIACHSFLSFVTGLLATLGLGLDLTNFWVVMLGVEACFFLENRRFKPFFAPEVAGAVSAFICTNVYVMTLSQDVQDAYFDWIKPFSTGFKSMISFDKATFGVESAPDRRDIIYLLSVAVSLSLAMAYRNSILMPLATVALTGFGLYVLEGEGFSFQFIIGQFGSVLAAAIEFAYFWRFAAKILSRGENAKSKPYMVACLLILVAGGSLAGLCWKRMQSLRAEMSRSIFEQRLKSPHIPDVETVIETESKPGDPVLILCDAARPAFPAMFFLDRKPGGYLLWGRPIRILGWCSIKGMCQGAYEKYYNHVYHEKVPNEIINHYPALVLVDKAGAQNELTPLGTLRLLDEHYDKIQDSHYYSNGKEPREFSGRNWDFSTYKRKPKPKEPGR